MHVLHRLLLAASSRLFLFSFFSDWARHSRLYTMSSKNCDVCTLLMRVRRGWRKWRDIETTIWCWWWIKTRQTSVQVSGAGMKSSFWYGKPHFIALFCAPSFLPFFLLLERGIWPHRALKRIHDWVGMVWKFPRYAYEQTSLVFVDYFCPSARHGNGNNITWKSVNKVIRWNDGNLARLWRVVVVAVKTRICEYL